MPFAAVCMDVLIWTSTQTTANGIERSRLETFRDDKGMVYVVLQILISESCTVICL